MGEQGAAARRLPPEGVAHRVRVACQQVQAGLAREMTAQGFVHLRRGREVDEAVRHDKTARQLRLLSVPRNTTVPGVGQVQNDIVSSNATSGDGSQTLTDYLNNANRGGSQVSYGNQLALPVGEGFLHVEPIYLSSASGTSFSSRRATAATAPATAGEHR